MKRTIAALLIFGMLSIGSTGCLGRGAMGKSVGKFNLEVSPNKWIRWGVFVLLGPVYGFAGGIDLMILNSIEFHTGTNPWSGEARLAKAGETQVQESLGGERVSSTLMADGSIHLVITEAGGTETDVDVVERDGEYVARNADGEVVARVRDARGPIPVAE